MRADKFFAEKFGSRTKAKEALGAGLVLRNGKPLSPKDEVSEADAFSFVSATRFVSEGGKKLARGLEAFRESVEGIVFADLGASTGGFTDCLLKSGAARVYCVDVGESQLERGLAEDPRVIVMDKTNARYLVPDSFPEKIGGIVSDLSFISLRLILPAVEKILPDAGKAFVLFKPQFECEGHGLGKSGILPQRFHAALLDSFYDFCSELSLAPQNIVNAPLREKKNTEYMVLLQKGAQAIPKYDFLRRASEIYETKL